MFQPSYIAGLSSARRIEENWGLVCKYWLIAALIVGFFILSWYTKLKVNQYEETAYDASHHTDTVNAISFLFEAKDDCNKEKDETEQDRCHETVQRVLDRHFSALDLAAQHTTAKATRGLLWIAAIQAMTGFATTLFLFWTVRQTKLILDQSTTTTAVAEETLEQTRFTLSQAEKTTEAANTTTQLTSDTLNATRLAERAHLRVELELTGDEVIDETNSIQGHEVNGRYTRHEVRPVIRNFGKSPAFNVRVMFGHQVNWTVEDIFERDRQERTSWVSKNIEPNGRWVVNQTDNITLSGRLGEAWRHSFYAVELTYNTVYGEVIGPELRMYSLEVDSESQRAAEDRRGMFGPFPREHDRHPVSGVTLDRFHFVEVSRPRFMEIIDASIKRMTDTPEAFRERREGYYEHGWTPEDGPPPSLAKHLAAKQNPVK